MSGRKNNLQSYQIITAGDMSADITSAVTNIQTLDNIGIQLNWTGSPVGVFEVQVSIDYAQDNFGNVINAGHWTPIDFQVGPSTTDGSPIYLDLNQLSAPWIRTFYDRTSGTGTLSAYITAKMI